MSNEAIENLEVLEIGTLVNIVRCAKEVFCQGIYVPCDSHPCGWDFIDFSDVTPSTVSVVTHEFDMMEISNGIYDGHPYEGMTLKQVLRETKGKYAFEIGSINW